MSECQQGLLESAGNFPYVVFERFTLTGTVEDREGLRLLQKGQSKKFAMFVKLNEVIVFEQ